MCFQSVSGAISLNPNERRETSFSRMWVRPPSDDEVEMDVPWQSHSATASQTEGLVHIQ